MKAIMKLKYAHQYPAWKRLMEIELRSTGLWYLIDGSEVPTSGASYGLRAEEKRAKAMKTILKTVDHTLIKLVLNAPDVRGAWDRLEEKFNMNTVSEQDKHVKKLETLQVRNRDPRQFIDILQRVYDDYTTLGGSLQGTRSAKSFLKPFQSPPP